MASKSRRALGLVQAFRAATRPGSPGLGERLGAVPRLVRATVSGRYHGTTVARLAMMALALVYVVSPVDLIPEAALLFAGLADDAMVLAWLATAVVGETEAFLSWEQDHAAPSEPRVVAGQVL